MPKPSSYPLTYEDCKSIEIKLLKQNGFIKSAQIKSGIIRWHIKGETTGKIQILVNTKVLNPYFELKYIINGESINYRIKLISEKSNLGNGKIWYFLCPFTSLKCRKLYLINKYFAYRRIFNEIYYENQLLSKSNRKALGLFKKIDLIKAAIQITNSKNFRRYYKKTKTKKFIKLKKIINQKINMNDFDNMK